MKIPRVLSSVLISCALVATASAASDYFLKIDGVEGDGARTKKKGYDHYMSVNSFSWGVSNAASQSDKGSSMPTGKRQHGSVTITKEWGASTPQFREAMKKKTVFPAAELQDGKAIITLRDVTVTGFKEKDGTAEITLAYQDMTRTEATATKETPAAKTR